MGDFSAGEAIGAGFRLIGRHPLAFLAWVLAYLLLGVVPQIAYFAAVMPEWSRMVGEIAASGGSHAPMNSAALMRAQGGMVQLQPVLWIASLVSHTLVLSAIYRAVLYPQDNGFLYLRLSGRELWMGLSLLVLVVVAILLMIVAMIPAGILAGVSAALAHDSTVAPLLVFAILAAAMGLVIWVMLRLSMATPLSFAQNGFRLYESWDLTRGQAGKMFLVALALAAIALVAELVVAAGVLLAMGVTSLDHLTDWILAPKFDVSRMLPWVVGGGIVAGVISTALATLFGAAWAETYRELTEDMAPEPAL